MNIKAVPYSHLTYRRSGRCFCYIEVNAWHVSNKLAAQPNWQTTGDVCVSVGKYLGLVVAVMQKVG